MADDEKQAETAEEPPKRKWGGAQPGAGRPRIPRKNVTYKVCRECQIVKPASEFYKRKENKDGLSDVCKACVSAAAQATRQKKLERQEQERLYLLEREMTLRKGRKNFFNFCQLLAPEFYKPTRWHLWLLCNTLQALYERHLTTKYF